MVLFAGPAFGDRERALSAASWRAKAASRLTCIMYYVKRILYCRCQMSFENDCQILVPYL